MTIIERILMLIHTDWPVLLGIGLLAAVVIVGAGFMIFVSLVGEVDS